jgi:hypothetical protein
VVVEKDVDNIGNDHSSLATNRWVSPAERVTYPGAKAADVDRHHVLDAAWMSHAAAGVATGVPGDNLTVRAFPVASVRTQRGSAAQALTVVGSVGHRTGVRHQGVAVSCRHGQGPGRRSPVLVSAAAADRMAAIAGLLAGSDRHRLPDSPPRRCPHRQTISAIRWRSNTAI